MFFSGLGPDESHTIHQLRATTVILEEGDNEFDNDEPVVANIILPNRPHYSAVQVEEVGSFKLESVVGQNYLSAEDGSSSTTVRQGIIDEVDSDTGEHTSTVFRRTVMRNVSIVSATSDDEAAMMTSGRDISVDEIDRKVIFENGETHIRVTKTVIEEQQVVELDENGAVGKVVDHSDTKKSVSFSVSEDQQKISETSANEVQQAMLLSVEHSKEENAKATDNYNVDTLTVKNDSKRAKMWTVESIDEIELPKELTEEELRRQRIKDIRLRARKGSLLSKEVSNEHEIDEIVKIIPQEMTLVDKQLNASEQEIHQQDQVTSNTQKKYEINEKNSKDSTNSIQQSVTVSDEVSQRATSLLNQTEDDEDDAFMAALLKRGQAQREALQQILSHEDHSVEPQKPQLDINSNENIDDQILNPMNSDRIENVEPSQHQTTVKSGQGIHLITISHALTQLTPFPICILTRIVYTIRSQKNLPSKQRPARRIALLYNRLTGFCTQHARLFSFTFL